MLGSVLRVDDPLDAMTQGRLGTLVNNWSSDDNVARLAPPPFGAAGCQRMTDPRVVNSRDWGLGHSDYFLNEPCLNTLKEQLLTLFLNEKLTGLLHA